MSTGLDVIISPTLTDILSRLSMESNFWIAWLSCLNSQNPRSGADGLIGTAWSYADELEGNSDTNSWMFLTIQSWWAPVKLSNMSACL